ncbi:MAG: hypothetical protein Q7S40_34165 [Opitutaceae bacterium]|nr:hypothetical protein [Opitutaceae bacterium]
MAVTPATRKAILDHLTTGAFELRVAANFEVLKATPAHDSLKAAVAQVATARQWIQQHLQEEAIKLAVPSLPLGKGLPLTRKERLGYRWP